MISFRSQLNNKCIFVVGRQTLPTDAPNSFDPEVSVLVATVVVSIVNQVTMCFIFLTFPTCADLLSYIIRIISFITSHSIQSRLFWKHSSWSVNHSVNALCIWLGTEESKPNTTMCFDNILRSQLSTLLRLSFTVISCTNCACKYYFFSLVVVSVLNTGLITYSLNIVCENKLVEF